ncbi:MAG: hypothetical protein KF727_04020 [Microbacteriaceae bacterium]|nr:hypothetical protein [Microbacteriaceae bacterium]
MRRLVAALAGAAVLTMLAGCGGAPAGVVTSAPEPAATSAQGISGGWVLTRTVVTNTTQNGLKTGDADTRYLVIDEGECAAASCTGELGSSADEAYLTGGGEGQRTSYAYDGTTLTYGFEPQLIDCVNSSDGSVTLAGAWLNSVSYELTLSAADGDTATAFAGSGVVEFVEQDPDALAASGCPVGGRIIYTLTLARA